MNTNASLGFDKGSISVELPALTFLDRRQVLEIISQRIRSRASARGIQILEAGCGRQWPFDLSGTNFTLTGVDLDARALDFRKNERRDLHEAVLGDLRTVDLPPMSFDIIYNSFVLEHVDGAKTVLENFARWLKPGGLIILRVPNRDSVYGFFTRLTPFWLHVMYKKYVTGNKHAGEPGYGPYPTFYDEAISRRAIYEFAAEHHLSVSDEYSFGQEPLFVRVLMRCCQWISLGKLSARHLSLAYVLESQ
jgi:SAM-dependent methyltransferase